jgi:branched-chain amino acid transport system ATP-binding protein
MEGRIEFAGRDLERLSISARAKLGIAHVPETRGVFFGLTVAEHLRLGYRGERLDAEAAYRFFPALRELRDRRCGLLSGGEQQMLAVGRALAHRQRSCRGAARQPGPADGELLRRATGQVTASQRE